VFILGLQERVVLFFSCCADHRRGRCILSVCSYWGYRSVWFYFFPVVRITGGGDVFCPEFLFVRLTVCLVTTSENSEGWLTKMEKEGNPVRISYEDLLNYC
jgi:hypothetical protein